MKVKELIAKLSEFDENFEVHFVYNYGDHSRTDVAPVVSKVKEENVIHSDYYRMDIIDEGYDYESHARTVVTIR